MKHVISIKMLTTSIVKSRRTKEFVFYSSFYLKIYAITRKLE